MVGERMRQSRLAAGLTLQAVAEKLSQQGQPITKAGLSKYEVGKSTPSATFLRFYGKVVGVSPAYFVYTKPCDIAWLGFRKLSRMPMKKQEQIKAYACHTVEGQLWLQETLFPGQQPNFPKMRCADSEEDVECAAMSLRRTWGLDDHPIDSLTSVVEDNGGVVVPCPDISDDFHGLAGFANRVFPVAVVSMQVPDDRRRYNLAHELGHLLLDFGGKVEKAVERCANRFASALLVPSKIARRELGARRRHIDIKELGLLKQKYGLSMQGWARRALDLEIIENGQYRSLCIVFSKNHWKRKEPVEFVGNEQPSRLKQMTLRALAEGIISRDKAAQLCPACVDETQPDMPNRLTASEIRRLPRVQRQEILAAAAEKLREEYIRNRQLTDFEAFAEDDLHDDHGETK